MQNVNGSRQRSSKQLRPFIAPEGFELAVDAGEVALGEQQGEVRDSGDLPMTGKTRQKPRNEEKHRDQ